MRAARPAKLLSSRAARRCRTDRPASTRGLGLTSTEHSYGIPETLLEDQTLQAVPGGLRLRRPISPLLSRGADIHASGAVQAQQNGRQFWNRFSKPATASFRLSTSMTPIVTSCGRAGPTGTSNYRPYPVGLFPAPTRRPRGLLVPLVDDE